MRQQTRDPIAAAIRTGVTVQFVSHNVTWPGNARKGDPMGQALETVKQFYRQFAANNWEGANACFGGDCKTVMPAGTMDVREHEAFGRSFKSALPDAHMELVKTVENGEDLFVEGRFRGTHTAAMVTPQGTLPASGNKLDLPFADYFRVQNGKIVEHHVFYDQGTMMAQMGAGPPR
jgi:ketosteroid isomerase-like protein